MINIGGTTNREGVRAQLEHLKTVPAVGEAMTVTKGNSTIERLVPDRICWPRSDQHITPHRTAQQGRRRSGQRSEYGEDRSQAGSIAIGLSLRGIASHDSRSSGPIATKHMAATA